YWSHIAIHGVDTLSLHDALPIYHREGVGGGALVAGGVGDLRGDVVGGAVAQRAGLQVDRAGRDLGTGQDMGEAQRGGAVIELHGIAGERDRKSKGLNSSHVEISYAVFCWKNNGDR